ncbi:hypothetical protein ACFXJO_04555 [Streptomyces lavendulae]|uniref:hypothetical protein n=1 Tax=Streptomyces lavendulae TaxID=1914 RepID=UPI0036987FE5
MNSKKTGSAEACEGGIANTGNMFLIVGGGFSDLPLSATGAARRDFFLTGSGIGSKIIMAPLFGSPFLPASLLNEFAGYLIAVGLSDSEVRPFRDVADKFSKAASWADSEGLFVQYTSAMDNVEATVREHCTAGLFKWLNYGKLLFQVAYQGTYAGTAPGGDVDLGDHRDVLFHLCGELELPETLRTEIRSFARMPSDTAMSGSVVDEARRLARITSAFFDL